MIICFDLDGTISSAPQEMRAIMEALRGRGDEVHVLTGHKGDSVNDGVIASKLALLKSLGCEGCFDRLAVVANPKNKVARQKAHYMKSVGASMLVDNSKKNVKAAAKNGSVGLRFKKAHRHG